MAAALSVLGVVRSTLPVLLFAALTSMACVSEELGERVQAVSAFCEAEVIGVGTLDVEGDYLPHVVNCENGAADFEALKAQAVAARSYLYYRLEVSGDIGDGTGDQVYSCGREPGPEHYRAVDETSGQILRYNDTQVAAFYVAGALAAGPGCIGGANDPTDTETYVTYNEGLSGDGITQTTLGFVDPSNSANRGCMSQNGTSCLAQRGDDHATMLRFYYGSDIGIEIAEGPCITSDPGTGDAGPNPSPETDGACACHTSAATDGLWLLAMLLLAPLRRRRA